MNLTEQTLPLCTLPDSKAEKLFFDDNLSGFGIRVRRDAAGRVRRKWFFQYRSKADGTQRRIALGNVDRPAAVLPDKARQAATAISVRVQVGEDPQKQRKAAKQGRKRLLLDEALRYLADRKAGIIGDRPMRDSTYRPAKRYFEQHWGALAKYPVAAITETQVKEQLRKIIEKHGKQAARAAKSNLSAFYVWAMNEGVAKSNPTIATHALRQNPPRKRVFDDDEIRAIWSACRDDDFGRIVKLLFFTGCRRDEIGGLCWSQVNLDTGVMTIPGHRTKTDQQLQLTLPSQAVEILRHAPHKPNRDFLFGHTGAAFSRWSYEKLQIEKRIAEAGHKLPQWGLHDIRRTVRTRLARIGVKPYIAELVIGHVGHRTGTVPIYEQYDYGPEITEALMRWSKALMTIVEPPESNVTPMRRPA
jgi:integrase